MKGRPKDPTRTKRRTGHRRKPDEAPIVRLVPKAADEKPILAPPATLPESMHETWANVISVLAPTGIRDADSMALEAMVVQYHRMIQAGQKLEAYGLVAQNESGAIYANPMIKVERDATTAFLRLAEHFGLTLASRMRLGLMQLAGKTLAGALHDDLTGDSE